jgi:CheY-like chemotaxis protein
MNVQKRDNRVRVLIADDDEQILDCYQGAFGRSGATATMATLDSLAADLFDPETDIKEIPEFDVVSCSQGEDAITLAEQAAQEGHPFDVAILDVRMPPGIDGVEAGTRIRELDPNVEIVFVTGFSDISREELARRIPPPMKLHYYDKPLSFTQLVKDVASMIRAH